MPRREPQPCGTYKCPSCHARPLISDVVWVPHLPDCPRRTPAGRALLLEQQRRQQEREASLKLARQRARYRADRLEQERLSLANRRLRQARSLADHRDQQARYYDANRDRVLERQRRRYAEQRQEASS